MSRATGGLWQKEQYRARAAGGKRPGRAGVPRGGDVGHAGASRPSGVGRAVSPHRHYLEAHFRYLAAERARPGDGGTGSSVDKAASPRAPQRERPGTLAGAGPSCVRAGLCQAASSVLRLRVFVASSGMPGPMVVLMVAFVM
ncbi:hypothetical protein GCM10009790_13540 [Georgenia ruanii]